MAPYRPPGRSNRSGRSNADNDVFEGLPVKQYGFNYSRVSLAPPVSDVHNGQDDKWGEPPMPRDFQLLQPWTQHILRLARSGKVGTKRKQDSDHIDEERHEDDAAAAAEEAAQVNGDERTYMVKKWKAVPEHALVPEHKHFEFLAKRRRGLGGLSAPESQSGANIPMRKTKVQRTDTAGEVILYEVLVPEGQAVEGEVTESTELPDVKPTVAAPGTVIEGVGIANDEGVLVAEHLKPAAAPRRNRPPPKKKGGPGRGKKRVTFTNPDGSTYTTIVPNATKIVPQPGQIIKHVAKGEEASADVTAEEAAAAAVTQTGEEGSGSEDGEDEGEDDDDDDREDGELLDDDAPGTGAATPATPAKLSTPALPVESEPQPMEDVQMGDVVSAVDAVEAVKAVEATEEPTQPVADGEANVERSHDTSDDVPLISTHSRTGSQAEPHVVPPEADLLITDAVSQSEEPEAALVEPAPAIDPASAQEVLLKNDPVADGPVEDVLVENAVIADDPVEAAPVEANPVEVAVVEAGPVEVTLDEAAPIDADPVELAPMEVDPIQVAPVEEAVVEDALPQDSHTGAVPATDALPKEPAVEDALVQDIPAEAVLAKNAAVEEAPTEELPTAATITEHASVEGALVEDAPSNDAAPVTITNPDPISDSAQKQEPPSQSHDEPEKVEEADDDLLGNLEKSLGN